MRDKILKIINDYWKFDNQQQPMSSWHDKQDLLKALEELLPKENVIELVCNYCGKSDRLEPINKTTICLHCDSEF